MLFNIEIYDKIFFGAAVKENLIINNNNYNY